MDVHTAVVVAIYYTITQLSNLEESLFACKILGNKELICVVISSQMVELTSTIHSSLHDILINLYM